MDEELLPYLVGIISGVVMIVVTTLLLGVPLSFSVFALRTLIIGIGGALIGWWLTTLVFER